MLMCQKQQFLYALTSSNINRFTKFYILTLLLVPSDVITDVIGIWSVFFESFESICSGSKKAGLVQYTIK